MGQCFFGVAFKIGVDGRIDDDVLLDVANQATNFLHHHIGSVMFGTGPETFGLGRRLRHRGLDLVIGDEPDIAHGSQNDLRPLLRRLRVARR